MQKLARVMGCGFKPLWSMTQRLEPSNARYRFILPVAYNGYANEYRENTGELVHVRFFRA